MKLGKLPARVDAIKFKLSNYINKRVLPKPPKQFGHETFVAPSEWGVLGNDLYGCCVWSGAAHETMLWSQLGHGKPAEFTSMSVLSDYTAVTGFNPLDNSTDQGTDMQAAASYRRKVGVLDAHGNRHKVEAYLAIDPGNTTQLYQALYLFGAVGIGIEFPGSAMDQFNAGKPWSVVKGSRLDGGHYIPLVAKRNKLACVTWGKLQSMTAGFYSKYCDEAVAYVSTEALVNNKSPEGFDVQTLLADLQSLTPAR